MPISIKRRRFLQSLAAAGAALPLSGAPSRPSFVILLADDLGWGDLGCYGHPTIRTPNLDRMAAEGTRFTQFYSAAPVCTPSRAALLTGRLPVRSGLTRVLSPFSKGGVPGQETTLAEALKPLGYATACVGKWHLGHLPQYLPTRHGFDRYFGLPYSNDMSPNSNPLPRWKNAPPTPLFRDLNVIEKEPDQRQLTPRYTAEAIAFLRDFARAGKPFFLYLPYTFPHVPLAASDRFRGKSARGLYGDAVEELDGSVGEILSALKELGRERDTLVTFSSDNGPWLIKKQDGGSAGLLRDGKASTWEGGMREPFIARWPGRIPAARVSQAFGTMMDIFPTCVSLAGGKLPANTAYDGADLSGVLLGKEPGREPLMFFYAGQDLRAVRKGPWKLHLASNDTVGGTGITRHEPPLLFNLLADPSEKYNLAAGNEPVVRDLLDVLAQHRKSIKFGTPQT